MQKETRSCKIAYQAGFYLKEKIAPSTNHPVRRRKHSSTNYKEIRRMRKEIAKKLRNFSKKSPITKGSVKISNEFKQFLAHTFRITNKFKVCAEIFDHFSLMTANHFNREEYCSFNTNTFELRVANQRGAKWKDQSLKE
jgi:hypothetical protein